jgi:hypothetical protein
VEDYAVGEDKDPSRHSQILFPPSLDDLERSPVWRREQRALPELRAKLPQRYTEEQLARLRTPGLPTDSVLPPELSEALRERRLQLAQDQPSQVSSQPEQPEQPGQSEQPVAELAKRRGPGHPSLEIPHLEDVLDALAKEEPDPRKRVTEKDINFVVRHLKDDHGVVVGPDQRQTVRRRIKAYREARITAPSIKPPA